MANKEITLGVGTLGIGDDLTTFSLYHTSVTGSNLIQANIAKATITGGTAQYDVDESLFTFIVVDDVYGGRQTINLPKPTITSFTPTSGETGDNISIVGSGFAGATAVSFGGTAASSFTKNSNTSITATVESGSTGEVAVTNPKGIGNLAGFSYIPSSGGGVTTYLLGRFGYDKNSPTGLCSSPNSYPNYYLYCAGYNSLQDATAAAAPVYSDSSLTTEVPYGFYVLRLDSSGPTTEDIGNYYEILNSIPVTQATCTAAGDGPGAGA